LKRRSIGLASAGLVCITSPIKDAGKQPRFADLAKNCAVLVESNFADLVGRFCETPGHWVGIWRRRPTGVLVERCKGWLRESASLICVAFPFLVLHTETPWRSLRKSSASCEKFERIGGEILARAFSKWSAEFGCP